MALASEQIAVQIAAQDLASAVIQRVNTNVNTLTTSTKNAGRGAVRMGEGLGKAANAVTNLAGNMLGLNNQVANIAEGLLSFAVGGPVVAAVAAGIAVLGGAWYHYTKDAREAKKATAELLTTLNKQADERAGVPVKRNIAEVRLEVARLEQQLAGLAANPFAVALGLTKGPEAALARARRAFGELASQAAVDLPDIGVEGTSGAQRAAERRRLFLARGLNSAEADLRGGERGAIGGREIGLQTVDAATLLNVDVPSIQGITQAIDPLTGALDALGASLGDVKLAFGEAFTAAIASANNFADATIGAVGKAIKGTARVLGREQFAKAAAKFAEGLFPPNPLAIASALKHVAAGSLFMALAGGGGGGGIGGGAGSGGGTRQDFDRRTNALADSQGTVTIKLPRDAVMHSGDPRWQEFMADSLRRATGRRVIVEPA